MIKKQIVLIIFITTLSLSCNHRKSERYNVFVYELNYDHGILRNTFTTVKDYKKIDSKMFELYKDSINDTSSFLCVHELNNEKLIFLVDTFTKIDSKKYCFENKEIEIGKYYHKRDFSDDKWSYVFYNPEYGLIGCFKTKIYRLDYIEYTDNMGLKEIFIKDIAVFINNRNNY